MRVLNARTATPAADTRQVRETVERIIVDVRERGDAAVREYSARFDSWSPEPHDDRGREVRRRAERRRVHALAPGEWPDWA